MNLKNTGKFIQDRRKQKGFTQIQLAQKIGVSEKTISKWECGKGFPDTSLILPLCNALNINANELLAGKLIDSDVEYKKTAENNLILLKAQKDRNAKLLLSVEWILGILSCLLIVACAFIFSFEQISLVHRILILVFGGILGAIGLIFCFIIETKAGFYECSHCHHKYVPSYKDVNMAMHLGRTRYMKCPQCQKKSWQKKVITKDYEKSANANG